MKDLRFKEEKLVLFVADEVIHEQIYDEKTGDVKKIVYSLPEQLKKLGIKFLPMPKNYILRMPKEDKRELKISDLGPMVLAWVDGMGRISNEYMGKNFRKPFPIDLNTLLALREIFVTNSDETKATTIKEKGAEK